MLKPPLQLDRSFLTEVQVEANPGHKPGKAAVSVTARQALGVLAEDASRWQVDLDIVVAPQPGEPAPPYTIHLHSIGLFSFPGTDHTEEQKAQLLAVTGTSILFSQAREYLLLLTSRGAWGTFQLPTVSFADVGIAKAEEEAAVHHETGPQGSALEKEPQPPSTPRRGKARRARRS